MNGFGWQVGGDRSPKIPSAIFGGSEGGVWHDISDLSTLFTDAGETTTVSAGGDLVRVIKDKSGNANDWVANADANRPRFVIAPKGGRTNQLTHTEAFDNAAWTKTNVTSAQVDGEVWSLDEGTATGNHILEFATNFLYTAAFSYAIDVKAGSASPIVRLTSRNTNATSYLDFNLSTGAVVATDSSEMITPTFEAESLDDGWYRLKIRCSGTSDDVAGRPLRLLFLDASRALSYAGTSRTILIRRPVVNTGNGHQAYQKVISQYEVTQSGVQTLYRLDFDSTVPMYGEFDATTPEAHAQTVALAMSMTATGGSQAILGSSNSLNAPGLYWATDNIRVAPSGFTSAAFAATMPIAAASRIYSIGIDATQEKVEQLLNETASTTSWNAGATGGTDRLRFTSIGAENDGGSPANMSLYHLLIVERHLSNYEKTKLAQRQMHLAGV